MGGSPGLVVMGGESHEFECKCRIHLIFVKIVCLKKNENNQKRPVLAHF